ncbi:MAG: hypothetical protein HY870_09005 [Chloroflexi bacterium]|nr:hypothetical protein [Chloroflexota bacterium]
MSNTQSNGTARQPGDERRFDRGSWIALAFALLLLAYTVLQAVSTWQVPGDGWELNGELRADPPRATFFLSYNDGPTPLQQGDELLSVEGLSLKEILARQFNFFEMHAPDWTEGTVLHYRVRRDGQELALDVPQHLLSPGQLLVATLRVLPGPTLVQLLSSLFFFCVGLAVFLLRPRNRAAHALLILGMAFLFQIVPTFSWISMFFYPFPPPSIPIDGWTFAINPSIMYLALAFPAPKWPIRRFPRLTAAGLYLAAPLALNAAYLLNLDNPTGYWNAATLIYVTQILCVFVITFGSLIHSALTLRGPAARAQLKWVALGLSSFIVPGIGGWLLGYLGVTSELLYLLSVTGWFLFPICLAIAITRYRLFDIDVIVRKTLVYSVLTALLALIYFGGVVLMQQLTRSITASSDLAIAVSTLIIAALFFPLRRRVQSAIDRRFFRRKYDAAKTLAAFGVTVRDEVELDRLTSELLSVVNETMQPESISLWLKPSSRGTLEAQGKQP